MRLARDGGQVHGEVTQLDAGMALQARVEDPRGRLRVVGDEASALAAGAGLHERIVPEHLEGLTGGDERIPHPARELGLTPKPLAIVQKPAHNRVGQATRHELGAPGAVERREHDRAVGILVGH